MSIAEPPEARPLDDETRDAAVAAVEAAKARGWTQADLRQWFDSKGLRLADYIAARGGETISDAARGVLAMISITGLPDKPLEPDNPDDDFPDVPAAMKAAQRWLVWRLETDEDPAKKGRKTPYYVTGERRHGTLDTEEDRARLATYEAACQVLKRFNYTGLGFALGPDETGGHWQGIDLDHLESHPGLQFVAEDLPGYTERSPSGAGVHAVGYGRNFRTLGSNATGIEAYANGRYFTVTGQSTGTGDICCLADFVEGRLAPLHNPRPQDTSSPQGENPRSLAGAMAAPDIRSALASMRSDDRELWVRMGHALKELGDVGRGLWIEWSQTSDKYDPADAARVWDSFQPQRTGYQAVFAEAQRRGWTNPASGHPISSRNQMLDRHNGSNSGHPETDADDTFEVLSIADIRALPDAQWVIKDALPAEGLAFVYGPPASFKSFVCYDLALSYAYGAPKWIGHERQAEGSVLYLASEGIMGAKNRIHAWQIENGIAEDTDRFHLIRKTINFLSQDDRARLVRTVARHVNLHGPVSLIFVDTVSRVLPGADENLQKDMTVFVGACDALREFGATVVGVHHTNKQGEMRGSTVFLGQGDAVYRVEREEGARIGTLTCEKLKDAPDGWKKAFEVRERAWTPPGKIEAASSLVAVFSDDALQRVEPEDPWPPKSVCRAVLKSLNDAWSRGKPWSPYPQTSKEGRFAIRNISQDHELPAPQVQMMLETWLKNDVLSLETVDSHSKAKGLKVLQWLD